MILQINGVEMPTPSSLTVMEYDITEGERDSTGTMHLDLIATKNKVECSWKHLTQTEMSTILSAISQLTFSVGFVNPTSGSAKTATYYKGDRTIPVMRVVNGVNQYQDFKVNFVEM